MTAGAARRIFRHRQEDKMAMTMARKTGKAVETEEIGQKIPARKASFPDGKACEPQPCNDRDQLTRLPT